MIYKVDDRHVPYDEDPVYLKAGVHRIGIKKGRCLAPVLIIACDFQQSSYATISFDFVGGKRYRLTESGEIVEL